MRDWPTSGVPDGAVAEVCTKGHDVCTTIVAVGAVVGGAMVRVVRYVKVAGGVLSSARRRGIIGVVTEATGGSRKGIWHALVEALSAVL